MSKERLCSIKERAMSLLEMGMSHDVKDMNSKELYEIMDIIKDAYESMKYEAEACYYEKITEAMEKNGDSENKMYMEKYAPETTKYYTRPYVNEPYRARMYYTEPYHDVRDGKSYNSRRMYMEAKESGNTDKEVAEMRKYVQAMTDDIMEMIQDASPDAKAMLKQNITQLTNMIK